jgi:hypothetical protein
LRLNLIFSHRDTAPRYGSATLAVRPDGNIAFSDGRQTGSLFL